MMVSTRRRRPGLYLIGLSLLMAVVFSACLSEIVFDVPSGNIDALAIRGRLVAGEQAYIKVEISRVSDFSSTEVPQWVGGAVVVLMNDRQESVLIPTEEPGRYTLDLTGRLDLEIAPGRSYQLSVATPDGKNYLSTVESLHPAPEPEGLSAFNTIRQIRDEAGNISDQEFVEFRLNTPVRLPDQSGGSLLKWEFSGTYRLQESNLTFPYPNTRTCYITGALQQDKVLVFNGNEGNLQELVDFPLLEEPYDYRFAEGFYLTVLQQSLSSTAYNYWKEIGELTDRSGDLFETPVGKVQGNFHNVADDSEEVFGHFYTSQERLIRLYVPPAENRVAPFCPLLVDPGDDSVPAVCLDCQSSPGSTVVKPDFWEE